MKKISLNYLDYEIIKAQNKGYSVFEYGEGRISSLPHSSLQRSILACQTAYPGCDVSFVVGGASGNYGKKWAVIFRFPQSV